MRGLAIIFLAGCASLIVALVIVGFLLCLINCNRQLDLKRRTILNVLVVTVLSVSLLGGFLAGCASVPPAAETFFEDAIRPPSERCAEAAAIYDSLPAQTLADQALVVAACSG